MDLVLPVVFTFCFHHHTKLCSCHFACLLVCSNLVPLPVFALHFHALRSLEHLLVLNVCFVSGKIVVVREKEHAVTLVSLPHGHTRTVPKAVLGFGLLVIIEAAGTQRCSQRDLVFRETFDDDGGYRLVGAQFGFGIYQILVGEGRHGFGGLFHGDGVLFVFFFRG